MKRYFLATSTVVGVCLAGQALSAETDMSKVTCKDISSMSSAELGGPLLWFSGFLHGKSGDTMFDLEMVGSNIEELREYCSNNPDATVMSAVEEIDKS